MPRHLWKSIALAHICEERDRAASQSPIFNLRVGGEKAARIMRAVLPHMGSRRSERIKEILQIWDDRPVKKREQNLPAECHPDRRHYARGLCRKCHYKFFRYDIHKMSAADIAARLSRAVSGT